LKSIKSANREVYGKAILQPEYHGMGTTFTGCYIQQDKAYTIHVGDSRLYIKRGSEFNLLTSDHTIGYNKKVAFSIKVIFIFFSIFSNVCICEIFHVHYYMS
ncbi:unnamed protein product, partial [marine sediment metagenome]